MTETECPGSTPGAVKTFKLKRIRNLLYNTQVMDGWHRNTGSCQKVKALRTLISMILIAVIAVSGFLLEKKLNEYRLAEKYSNSITEEYIAADGIDFSKLKKRNNDVIAWIRIPDTRVNYPVVQGEDNEYYLHRDLDGNYVYDGTIFVDAAVEMPFESDNTILYGHRMISGAMFATVKYYADEQYMKEHPTVYIETPDKSYELPVIAFCEDDDDTEIYTTEFYKDDTSGLSKEAFVDLIKVHAVNLSGEPFSTEDKFVILSTCKKSEGIERQQLICKVTEKASPKDAEKDVQTKEGNASTKWLILQIVTGIGCICLIALNLRK